MGDKLVPSSQTVVTVVLLQTIGCAYVFTLWKLYEIFSEWPFSNNDQFLLWVGKRGRGRGDYSQLSWSLSHPPKRWFWPLNGGDTSRWHQRLDTGLHLTIALVYRKSAGPISKNCLHNHVRCSLPCSGRGTSVDLSMLSFSLVHFLEPSVILFLSPGSLYVGWYFSKYFFVIQKQFIFADLVIGMHLLADIFVIPASEKNYLFLFPLLNRAMIRVCVYQQSRGHRFKHVHSLLLHWFYVVFL